MIIYSLLKDSCARAGKEYNLLYGIITSWGISPVNTTLAQAARLRSGNGKSITTVKSAFLHESLYDDCHRVESFLFVVELQVLVTITRDTTGKESLFSNRLFLL